MSGISRKYGLSFPEAAELFANSAKANSFHQELARVRYMLVERGKGQWDVPIIVAHGFTNDEEVPEHAKELNYSSVRLLEDWVPLYSLVQCFRNARLELPNMCFPFVKNRGPDRTFLSGNNRFHRRPGHLYSVDWQDNTHSNHDILLTYSLPYCPDVLTAMRQWTGLVDLTDSHTYRGKFHLFVPECRAFISKLVRVGAELQIKIVRIQSCEPHLRIKGAYWKDSEEMNYVPLETTLNADGSATVPLPEEVRRLELFLLGPSETLYDFHREGRWPLEGTTSLLTAEKAITSDEKIIQEAIKSGEGVTFEFKPYIEPSNPKFDEVIHTAIALANKMGGYIFLGVADDCQIIGVERELVSQSRNTGIDFERQVSRYVGTVLQAVRGRIIPSVNVDVASVSFAGHRVIIIKVPAGDEPPYRDTQGDRLFIRRGANNVLPSNEELRELLSPPQQHDDLRWRNA
ncbi:MAG: AlbA family DNA-binding domain-containing protein [Sulfuricaulis sp.]